LPDSYNANTHGTKATTALETEAGRSVDVPFGRIMSSAIAGCTTEYPSSLVLPQGLRFKYHALSGIRPSWRYFGTALQ